MWWSVVYCIVWMTLAKSEDYFMQRNESSVFTKWEEFIEDNNNNNNNILFTAIGLLLGGSGYFTFKQNMKFVTTKFKSGGLHDKHVVATWNLGNHLSICF